MAAASSSALLSITGGSHYGASSFQSCKPKMLGSHHSQLAMCQNKKLVNNRRKLSVSAKLGESSGGDGGGEFVAGFFIGGAVFGALAYAFAPQIRKAILNEDDHGFRRPRRLVYYDDGLENTRQTLNEKIHQLNSAIDNVSSRLRDNVSSRLRGGKKKPKVEPIEEETEYEAM